MKILYTGAETFEFTYGGEYDVVRKTRNGFICIDNLGDESHVIFACCKVI